MYWLRRALLLTILIGGPALADDDTAKNELGEALIALNEKDYALAIAKLNLAERATDDPDIRAKIRRGRAYVAYAQGDTDGALLWFYDALALSPIEPGQGGADTAPLQALHACAKALHAQAVPRGRVAARRSTAGAAWTCPDLSSPPVPITAVPATRTTPVFGWVALAAGAVVGSLVGSLYLVESGSDQDEFDALVEKSRQSPRSREELDMAAQLEADVINNRRGAAVAYGIGGAVAIVGVVLIVSAAVDTEVDVSAVGPGPAPGSLIIRF